MKMILRAVMQKDLMTITVKMMMTNRLTLKQGAADPGEE